jgi:hypothetical protein
MGYGVNSKRILEFFDAFEGFDKEFKEFLKVFLLRKKENI